MSPEAAVLQVTERVLGYLAGPPDELASEVESVELQALLGDMEPNTLALAGVLAMVLTAAVQEEAERRA